jgi:transposase InsO family protein
LAKTDLSKRRARGVLGFAPKSHRYRSRRRGQPILEARIKENCTTRIRHGYRRVHVLLRRLGDQPQARTRRLFNELGLQLRSKVPRRRGKEALRADRTPPSGSNEVWAMYVMHDQLETGGKFRILTVIGIAIERIRPGKSTRTGRLERMHLTLKTETTGRPGMNSLQQQVRFDDFIQEFNTEKPHEALAMQIPAEFYALLSMSPGRTR